MLFDRHTFIEYIRNNKNTVYVRFTASWCNPCQVIKPTIDKWFKHLEENPDYTCITIDIDENIDLFAMLKTRKMVTGIPTILCYNSECDSFVPTDSVSGTHISEINNFFESN